MNDLIPRQAAIDVLHMDTSIIPFRKAREYADATIEEIRSRLENLPSAQPEVVKDTIVPCKDTISRQAAIDAAIEAVDEWDGGCNLTRADMIADAINNTVPSAQPEIVRCKDCKYADDDCVCQNSMGLVIQDDDDYCSYAERRTGGV